MDRLDNILRMLADRPGMSASELAMLLDTTPRTIFRDLDTLRDRGYPIESSTGRGGGLRLHPNWGLGKVLLSADEGIGVILALAVMQRLQPPMFDTGLSYSKILDAFPRHERRRIEPLRERVFVGANASPTVRDSYGAPRAEAMRTLQEAFIAARSVFGHYTRQDGATNRRRIEPHALVINWPAWYLLGWDFSHEAFRTFRLDRFTRVEDTISHFKPRPRDAAAELLNDRRIVLRPL